MWNERYSEPGFAYGEAPNDFLVEAASHLPKAGRVLCLAEGEGRNAVWLAEQGHDVTAVDLSQVGLDKTLALARARGVEVRTVLADLADWELGTACWDGIVSIWGHFPPPVRARVHRSIPAALRPGGVLLLEAYHVDQLERGTGGPPARPMLYEIPALRDELAGLDMARLERVERDIHEGPYHDGPSVTCQVVGLRTGPTP